MLQSKLKRNILTSPGILLGLVCISFEVRSENRDMEKILSAHTLQNECVEGLNSFQNTLHGFLQTSKCRFCHSGGGPGPGYISPDVNSSYFSVKNHVNFEDIDRSKLVARGAAPHGGCSAAICNQLTADQLRNQISSWWEGGEKDCENMGRLFSSAVELPVDTPVVGQESRDQYKSIEIDLTSVASGLKGMKIEFEVQHFALPTETTPGALRIRKPRFKGQSQIIKLANLRFLVNRKWDIASNAYLGQERVLRGNLFNGSSQVEAHFPSISTSQTILIYEPVESSLALSVSASFDKLELSDDLPPCNDSAHFIEQVAPLVEARNCAGCHGPSNSQQSVRKRARESLLISSGDATLVCSVLKQVAYPDYAGGTVLFNSLSQPRLGHPTLFSDRSDSLQIFQEWTEREFK